MAYVQQTWGELDPTTPLSADRLNHLEQGVHDVAAAVDSLPSSTSIAEAVAAETSRAEAAETLLSLTRTAVKTANYTAAPSDLVPVDTTSGNVTITLPTAPTGGSRIAVKHIIQGSANTVTVATGGSDVINKAAGSTTVTLSLVNQMATFVYDSSTHIWTISSTDPGTLGAWTSYNPVLSGTGWAIGNGTLTGSYEQVGKTVRLKIIYTAGSTSTYSATITPSFSLPVTGANTDSTQFGAEIVSGANIYLLHGRKATTTTASVYVIGTNGLQAPLTSASTPAAASGVVVTITGQYQAA